MCWEIDIKLDNEKDNTDEDDDAAVVATATAADDFRINNNNNNILLICKDEEEYKIELEKIMKKLKNYKSLWRLFSMSNKILMIINFITILLSIFITEGNVTLALSIFTLSFSFVCDTRRYLPILENLLIIYQDEIIPNIKKCIRQNKRYYGGETDVVDKILKIEKEYLTQYLGKSFVLSNTLRGMDWKKIVCISLVYIISFVGIGLLCYYKNMKQI